VRSHTGEKLDDVGRHDSFRSVGGVVAARGVERYKLNLEDSKVCNRFFAMGQGAGSRVATRRFQAVGQLTTDLKQLVQPLTMVGPCPGAAQSPKAKTLGKPATCSVGVVVTNPSA
jgi:hypothetical protein